MRKNRYNKLAFPFYVFRIEKRRTKQERDEKRKAIQFNFDNDNGYCCLFFLFVFRTFFLVCIADTSNISDN